ncbi:transposase [Natronococcus pandeyae]|uniref:Transposase n=2 Tax=Natronococcus pandeyae TaxID=2055836 RepID=A0A8J8TQZ5_9EURY|nr:transposase [Natronococcus pandeyae]
MEEPLDSHGFAASKLWNVARWTCDRIWSETGEIPGEDALKAYLKNHERYGDLHSQSSQRVLEELAEAFAGWYAKRQNGDDRANPPGYRKHGDDHPRSTVTWKNKGFKLDTENNRVRLSKGRNHKEYPSEPDYILCEYNLPPEINLSKDTLQQVRAVYKHGEWRLQFVCKYEITVDETGEQTAGVDLGIVNFAAVSYSSGDTELYPGHALKEDEYYFLRHIAKCNDPQSNKATRLHEKRSERRSHYIHAATNGIIHTCLENDVGELFVGSVRGIRDAEDEDGNKIAVSWGSHGNLDLYSWPFDLVVTVLKYKGALNGIRVTEVDERDTSKTCCSCGHRDDSQRVERGLYVCEECFVVAQSDVGGAENIRLKGVGEFESTSESTSVDVDRSNGCLAQPVVNLFRRGEHVPSCGQGTLVQQTSIAKP